MESANDMTFHHDNKPKWILVAQKYTCIKDNESTESTDILKQDII